MTLNLFILYKIQSYW